MDIQLPQQFKALGHYLKLATDFDKRDPVIAYWCRYHAVQTGLAIDKSSPEAKNVIISLLSILEQKKKELHDNESITNDDVAEAYIENYILKLFTWADTQDRNCVFNKNVVKAFYNAGVLIDVLCNFNNGELTEEFDDKRKYAKWKAAYIHNCLKSGVTPKPGPMESESEEGDSQGPSIYVPPPQNPAGIPPQNYNSASSDSLSSGGGGAGFGASQPSPAASANWSQYVNQEQPTVVVPPQTQDGVTLGMIDIEKAQKYCKWASSALTFDDVPEAIINLEKALYLLKTGKDGG